MEVAKFTIALFLTPSRFCSHYIINRLLPSPAVQTATTELSQRTDQQVLQSEIIPLFASEAIDRHIRMKHTHKPLE